MEKLNNQEFGDSPDRKNIYQIQSPHQTDQRKLQFNQDGQVTYQKIGGTVGMTIGLDPNNEQIVEKRVKDRKEKARKSILNKLDTYTKEVNARDTVKLPEIQENAQVQRPLGVALNVLNFIAKLKERTGVIPQHLDTQIHHGLFNDLAYAAENIKPQSAADEAINNIRIQTSIMFTRFLSQMVQFLSTKIHVFDPNSRYLTLWDFYHSLIILIAIFYIPVEWSMSLNFGSMYEWRWYSFTLIASITFFCNILINLNTGYYDQGTCIMERMKIIRRYAIFGIVYDLMSLFPMVESFIHLPGWWRVINGLIFLKLKALIGILSRYDEMFHLKKDPTLPAIVRLLKLALMIILLGHVLAVLFLGVSSMEKSRGFTYTWIEKYSNDDPTWLEKYIFAFYWSVTTMTTVGYGDITASNAYEAFFVTCALFISVGVFSYSISLIGMIVQDMNAQRNQYTSIMRLTGKFFKQNQIPLKLQNEVRKDMEYRFFNQEELSGEEIDLLFTYIDPQLKRSLIIESNRRFLLNCPPFSSHFSQQFIKRLSLTMERQQFIDKQIIFQEGTLPKNANNYIYFIQSGHVELFVDNFQDQQQHICLIKTLTKLNYFGQVTFFLNRPRSCNARALGLCQVLKISKDEFLRTLKEFSNDYQQFVMMRQQCTFEDLKFLKVRCFSCEQNGHTVQDCPKMHFLPDQQHAVLRSNYSVFQQRNLKYKRKQKERTINTLIMVRELRLIFGEPAGYIRENEPEIGFSEFQRIDGNKSNNMLEASIAEDIEQLLKYGNQENQNNNNFNSNNNNNSPNVLQVQTNTDKLVNGGIAIPILKNNINNYQQVSSQLDLSDNISQQKKRQPEDQNSQLNDQIQQTVSIKQNLNNENAQILRIQENENNQGQIEAPINIPKSVIFQFEEESQDNITPVDDGVNQQKNALENQSYKDQQRDQQEIRILLSVESERSVNSKSKDRKIKNQNNSIPIPSANNQQINNANINNINNNVINNNDNNNGNANIISNNNEQPEEKKIDISRLKISELPKYGQSDEQYESRQSSFRQKELQLSNYKSIMKENKKKRKKDSNMELRIQNLRKLNEEFLIPNDENENNEVVEEGDVEGEGGQKGVEEKKLLESFRSPRTSKSQTNIAFLKPRSPIKPIIIEEEDDAEQIELATATVATNEKQIIQSRAKKNQQKTDIFSNIGNLLGLQKDPEKKTEELFKRHLWKRKIKNQVDLVLNNHGNMLSVGEENLGMNDKERVLLGFDRMRQFDIFMPHNNITAVMLKMKNKFQRIRTQIYHIAMRPFQYKDKVKNMIINNKKTTTPPVQHHIDISQGAQNQEKQKFLQNSD